MLSPRCLLGVLMVCLLARGKCDDLPEGTFALDCLDRYLRIGFDPTFTGENFRFEAIGSTAVHPITEHYAAECGYSISLLPHIGLAELRASYFSCHAVNEDDSTFTISFNLIVTKEGQEETYALSKTCSPSLPWSSRERSCEVNYMEVIMRNDMRFPTGPRGTPWNLALDAAHSLAQNDWQVFFQKGEQQLTAVPLPVARERGYVISMTKGRFVFRVPYHQPDSTVALLNGVKVDTVQAVMFSRQGWTVLVVDFVAACPIDEGFSNGSTLVWVNPLESSLSDPQSEAIRIGTNGVLLEPTVSKGLGYELERFGSVVNVMIPYNATGGYRKSFVEDNVYREYYLFNLYFEHQYLDGTGMDTRLRHFNHLVSPLLSRHAFSVNATVLSERSFTVYLGAFADDVELMALRLSGGDPLGQVMTDKVSKVVHPNGTHGYVLKMPFDDPIVLMELSAEEGILQYILNMHYTLSIVPAMQSFHHNATIVAVFKDAFPPVFATHCFEKGIGFKLDLGPYAYLWVVYAGASPLTEEFALEQGYIMTKDGHSLMLDVPVFTAGYVYENIAVKTFSGTFEVFVRDLKTLKVRSTTVKTCQFATNEMIVCSATGRVTVVANLSMAVPSVWDSYSISLLERTCGVKEKDKEMALFTFGVNTCGTRVKLAKKVVIYENEVVFRPKFFTTRRSQDVVVEAPERVTVQCIYSLMGLYRLFQLDKFVSDFVGVGSIEHIKALGQPQQTMVPDARPTLPAVNSGGDAKNEEPVKYREGVRWLKDSQIF